MKTLSVVIFSMLISMSSFAKHVPEDRVPVLVKSPFYDAYPDAEKVKWEITELGDYKASFKMGHTFASAFYTKSGEFIEADETIEWRQVPFTGRMGVYHLHQPGHITNVLKICNSKDTFYQIDVKSKHKHYEILLDQEGNIIG